MRDKQQLIQVNGASVRQEQEGRIFDSKTAAEQMQDLLGLSFKEARKILRVDYVNKDGTIHSRVLSAKQRMIADIWRTALKADSQQFRRVAGDKLGKLLERIAKAKEGKVIDMTPG